MKQHQTLAAQEHQDTIDQRMGHALTSLVCLYFAQQLFQIWPGLISCSWLPLPRTGILCAKGCSTEQIWHLPYS